VSIYLTGGVALAYAAGVVTVHRVAIARRRKLAHGYPTLRWLDWGALLQGVLPPAERVQRELPSAIEGGPPPQVLARAMSREVELLEGIIKGLPLQLEAFQEAAFSGGEARWLGLLSRVREEPRRVLEELEATPANTAAEAYLREWLALEYDVTPLNLEFMTFAAKRRINLALQRFGDQASLYFIRARASSLLGFTQAVLDDLARAVYFSGQAHFYLQAVTQMSFVEDVRPALVRACQEALEREPGAEP
jgi:enoyl-CoA hydratase/carnithine racemase